MGRDFPYEWRVSPEPVPYTQAIDEMEHRVAAVEAGAAPELFWLLEHPPTYTAGTSAGEGELLDAHGFPVVSTGRGGRYTYHGPGQRVIYVVADLRRQGRDLRAHVQRLEEWTIRTLATFDIKGERREGRIGIWVERDGTEEKIGAIGVRVRRWIAYHGLALNVDPDLTHFKGIVPCGIVDFGVTSMRKLGSTATMAQVDGAFRRELEGIFKG
jgi:lipoyl(octanoyl) transferase